MYPKLSFGAVPSNKGAKNVRYGLMKSNNVTSAIKVEIAITIPGIVMEI
jgi:hypothetical protein